MSDRDKNMDQKSGIGFPTENWVKIRTVDMHTCGEPLRIIQEGIPKLKGQTILEKRKYFMNNLDQIRTGLIYEPRGHADMYGAVITKPERSDSDFGVIFLHNEGYSTMCGHAIIALAKFAYETQLIPKDRLEMKIDTPAGQVIARVAVKNNLVQQASFQNVPSFLYLPDQKIYIDGIGTIGYDIAFGGAFYAICRASDCRLSIETANSTKIIETGILIKKKIAENIEFRHPVHEDLGFLYGVIFTAEAESANHHSRNACVFASGELDRSPTGTGVSARVAALFHKNQIGAHEKITIESIIGTTMDVEVINQIQFGPYQAVVPEVTGTAYFTGQHSFYFDPDDPLVTGFIIR